METRGCDNKAEQTRGQRRTGIERVENIMLGFSKTQHLSGWYSLETTKLAFISTEMCADHFNNIRLAYGWSPPEQDKNLF